ncbi:hypothetical protein T484DRAFT_1930968 [Baffinella frigidus]|nr:hypothetical protein T484DRAFT_1930968 [Cryptophyta sp. CCMP2293]|mmetsp:Transcript_15957/g.38462  ORF Transcript_15957/g.38462 Transcript_15957/m.38462 type:complete len:94 (+) Transcript_15957:47-328(+)
MAGFGKSGGLGFLKGAALPLTIATTLGGGTVMYALLPMLEEAKHKTPDVRSRQERMDKAKKLLETGCLTRDEHLRARREIFNDYPSIKDITPR